MPLSTVTLLLAVVFYLYGVAGVHLFGSVDPKHFGSLSAALLSLFRLITLDEIEERDRLRHLTETGRTTLPDELALLERQIEELKRQASRLRQRAGSKV